jgi:hypothetical protein
MVSTRAQETRQAPADPNREQYCDDYEHLATSKYESKKELQLCNTQFGQHVKNRAVQTPTWGNNYCGHGIDGHAHVVQKC